MIKKLYLLFLRCKFIRFFLIFIYKINGRKPWTLGYVEYKWENIKNVLGSNMFLEAFRKKNLSKNFGIGIDERIVEYGWVFSNIKKDIETVLDAGSVFNFYEILSLEELKDKQITIFTYYPEPINFNNRGVSYVYGDLRNMPFRDDLFDEIVCQSTIEHIDMDNSIFGYNIKNSSNSEKKSYDYMKAVGELYRTLKPNGQILLTFPFGKFEKHGFFQQFDSEMIARIKEFFDEKGEFKIDFIKYSREGWNFCEEADCKDIFSYNPHTGKGKGTDGAAHCRAVCCIKFLKK